MKLSFTKHFVRDYRKLPTEIQKAVDKQLELLLSNPQHPSLNFKEMQDPRNIWECRVTAAYRFTLQVENDVYLFEKGRHSRHLRHP